MLLVLVQGIVLNTDSKIIDSNILPMAEDSFHQRDGPLSEKKANPLLILINNCTYKLLSPNFYIYGSDFFKYSDCDFLNWPVTE